NGRSVGLTINLPMEQVTNPHLTDHLDFKYFFARKVCLSFSAEAYVYFPGGFGTLDELFEILTLVQTEKIAPVPIILFGKRYWKNLDKFIRKNLLKREMIDKTDVNLYTISEDIDEVIDIIKKAPVRRGFEED
ncbi:MAG: LOG family protein, partial [Candidatus Shapirobacteria bacterium]|nr:LOG family protein [Candidatus Shapirobacteria bacterium]